MVIVELMGRLGNAMFMIALGKYLADQINTELYIIKKNITGERKNYYFEEIFPFEFFKKMNILDPNYDTSSFQKIMDPNKYKKLSDFPIKNNIIICDWFLSKNYVNYNSIKDLYIPSKELKEEIFDLYSPTRNTLLINIRRGDFLNPYNIKQGWHSEPKQYWESTYKFLNKKYDKILVTSDDTKWCKDNLDFCNNLIIVDKPINNSKIFFDLFLPTFVGDNIISASTFSWWGSYLNQNPNKQIIMPYPWNTLKKNRNDRYYLDNTIKFDIYNYKEIK